MLLSFGAKTFAAATFYAVFGKSGLAILDECGEAILQFNNLSETQQATVASRLPWLGTTYLEHPCALSRQQLSDMVSILRTVDSSLNGMLKPLADWLPIPRTLTLASSISRRNTWYDTLDSYPIT